MYKLVFPEVVGSVLNEFYECDEESPGVGPVHYQPLQENTVLDRGRGWGNLCVYTHNYQDAKMYTAMPASSISHA